MIQTGRTELACPDFHLLTEDQMEEMLRAAFDVMRTVGFKVLHGGARTMLKKAGAPVKDDRVKLPEHLVRHCMATAPKGWTIYDRGGRRAMEVSGRNSYFGTSTAAPNFLDPETGKMRPTVLKDIANGARLADALDDIEFVMPFGSSTDVPGYTCDINEFPAVVANTTKPMVFISYSGRGAELVYEMAAVVAGGLDRLAERPFVMAYPEPIAPMVYPAEAVDRLFVAADLCMPQIPGASILMGATGPVTIAGAVVQGLCESMMSMTLAQLRRPGCPVALSTNMAVMDMATGLSKFGEPAKSTALCVHAEVARYLGFPTWGLAGASDSKGVDAQAGAEATLHIFAQAAAGVNLIHDVGYLDSAMICSPEQLVFGNEVIGMVKHFLKPVRVNRETLAKEVIEAVGPGGHFLTQDHTLAHFREMKWTPGLMNRQPYREWEASGGKNLAETVREKTRRILAEHKPPEMPGKVLDELERIRVRGEKELARLFAE